MYHGDSGRYSSSSTGGIAGRGSSPSGIGGTGGRVSSQSGFGRLAGNSNSAMQAAVTIVPAVAGLVDTVCGVFTSGNKDKEREQQMLSAEKLRHEEQMRNLEEEMERVNQNRSQVYADRHENFNKANLDLQRRQMEWGKREQELSKQKDEERKKKDDLLQRERELYDQRIRAAEGKNQQLMADTKASMEADHQNFLETKAHMVNTHQMEVNMVKTLAGATAYLYKELGYCNGPPKNNGHQGVQLLELESAPTCQQMENNQPGEANDEQRPNEIASSPGIPDCFKCGSLTRITFCSHFFCPNCHVNEGKLHCPVCQKVF